MASTPALNIPEESRVATVAKLRRKRARSGLSYYLAEAGKEGWFRWDQSDTTSTDNVGTVVVTTNGQRLKRVFLGYAKPEWFGAKGDAVYDEADATLESGTNDHAALYNCLTWSFANRVGGVQLTGRYLCDGLPICLEPDGVNTVYSFNIQGTDGNPRGSRGTGTSIVKTTPGDWLRVNMDPDGFGVLPFPSQYTRFSAKMFSVVGKRGAGSSSGDIVQNIVGIKAWRTRCTVEYMCGARVERLIDQPSLDANNDTNYCDMSQYRNIAIFYSTGGGIRISKPDASEVAGFWFEKPYNGVEHAIECYEGSGTEITKTVNWADTVDLAGNAYIVGDGNADAAKASFIYLHRPQAVKISAGHWERMIPYKSCVEVFGGSVSVIDGVHTRFDRNDFVWSRNSDGTIITNCDLWDVPADDAVDIRIDGEPGNNMGVVWSNVIARAYPTSARRELLVAGESGRYDDALDGHPARFNWRTLTDANQVITRDQLAYVLPTITADRTVDIPVGHKHGAEMVLIYRGTGSFKWFRTGAEIRKSDGKNLAQIPQDILLVLSWDSTANGGVGYWRVLTPDSEVIDRTMRVAITGRTADYTATDEDHLIPVGADTGPKTQTLPTAVGREGRVIGYWKSDATANVVTIQSAGGTINGLTESGMHLALTAYELQHQGERVRFVAYQGNWWIIDNRRFVAPAIVSQALTPERGLRAAQGLQGEAFSRHSLAGSTAFTTLEQRATLVGVVEGQVIEEVYLHTTVAASGMTQAKVCIWSTAGTLLTTSADVKASFQSTKGVRGGPVAAPYTVPSGVTAVYLGAHFIGGTPPTVARGTGGITAYGGEAAPGGVPPAVLNAGVAGDPANLTIGTGATTCIWVGWKGQT